MAGLDTRLLGLLIGALCLSIMRLAADLAPLVRGTADMATVQHRSMARDGDVAACLFDRSSLACLPAQAVSTDSWSARAGAKLSEI